MTAHVEIVPSVVDRIKQTMVGLKMPRAIEILDATVRRLERGEVTAPEAIDALLAEEFTVRENRRVKTALSPDYPDEERPSPCACSLGDVTVLIPEGVFPHHRRLTCK